MGKIYFSSFRLAFALVCVGASLILGGHWLGLVPDGGEEVARARQTLSECIAVNAAAHVRKQQWLDLKSSLQTMVDRDENLLSVGLRSDSGALRVDAGHHAELWETIENKDAAIEAIKVPITLNRRGWGNVELCFHKPVAGAWGEFMAHPMIRLLAFFFVTGLVAYTVFVAKVLRLFNDTQVVPERVRQALDTLAEGLLVLDENGKIVLANHAFADTIGKKTEELANRLVDSLAWERPQKSNDEDYPWTRAIHNREIQTERMLRFQMGNGEVRIFSVNAAPLGNDSRHKGALATFRDVTQIEEHRVELEKTLSMLRGSRDEIERKNAELEVLATQDALTGCLNRRAFFDQFDSFWKESKRTGEPMSCIMIDNDHFKNVNDTYGHYVGDEVLRAVSRVIRERHADNGLVCRYGGEEFCVLLPNVSFEDACKEADLTRIAISNITFDEPAELVLTASIGVTETRFNPADPQDLINQADICLYTAKRNGRNCVIAYSPEMSTDDIASGSESEQEKIDIPYQAVTALVAALSYRDANTGEHSRRVADLCARVADGILTPQETFVLEIAALLHDIGKVGVPDHILLKPGPLTDEEWEVMSRHDRIGAEIVAGAFDCHMLNDIIASSHAFYGGNARNASLPVGEEIPLAARLLMICDSYDAIISNRVYRKGASHDAAITELRRCAGTQFDPKLVEHFAEMIIQKPFTHSGSEPRSGSHAAIQIGHQVERLAEAIDSQDASGLKTLAGRLGMYARSCDIESIAIAAERIEQDVNGGEIEWIELLRDTRDLLDVCRAAQNVFLRDSLEENNLTSL